MNSNDKITYGAENRNILEAVGGSNLRLALHRTRGSCCGRDSIRDRSLRSVLCVNMKLLDMKLMHIG